MKLLGEGGVRLPQIRNAKDIYNISTCRSISANYSVLTLEIFKRNGCARDAVDFD